MRYGKYMWFEPSVQHKAGSRVVLGARALCPNPWREYAGCRPPKGPTIEIPVLFA